MFIRHARHVLAWTQAAFFGSLGLCCLINFSPTAQVDGISFYGVDHQTWPILTIGFFAGALGLWVVSSDLTHTDAPRWLIWAVRAIALGLPGLLLTPYNQGAWLNWTHMGIGVTMALVQFAVAIDLVLVRRRFASVIGLVIQFGGGLLAACSLPTRGVHSLLQGELVLEIGFSIVLIEWTYAVHAGRVAPYSRAMELFDLTDRITIAAPAQRVFALISDLALMGSWSPENTGGVWLDGATGPTLGARFEGTNEQAGDTWSTVATVTAYDAPTRFSFHVTWQDIAISDWQFDVVPTAQGCVLEESWADRRPQSMRDDELAEGFDRAHYTVYSIRTTLERVRDACEQ